MIQQERNGKYPGGDARRLDRLKIIAGHARAASVGCLAHGEFKKGFSLYMSAFGWNIRMFRLRYLVAFPILAIRYSMKSQ